MLERTFRRRPTELFAFAALAAAGCSSLFGIDEPHRTRNVGTGGSATEPGGEAGEPSGAAGETSSGGVSGAGRGGTTSGGRGGSQAGKGGRSGGGTSGTSGTSGAGEGGAGAPPDDGWPAIGDECSTPGALACPGPAANQALLCDGSTWVLNQRCNEYQRCDRRSGSCTFASGCTATGAYCFGGDLVHCGPDLTTTDTERCPLGCSAEEHRCQGAVGDQLVVDRLPEITSERTIWPDPIIPVCLRGADSHAMEWRAVRTEVESTWGRYGAVAFPGWDECTASSTGVELSFVEDCDGELGAIERWGYPGPGGRVPIRLCLSYYDTRSLLQPTPDSLLRFVARHEFGHLLGREDTSYDPARLDFMMSATNLSTYRDMAFGYDAVWFTQWYYGPKPSRSLVTALGSCVALSSGDFSPAACDGAPEQAWQPDSERVQHVESGTCVRAGSAPGSIETGDCAFASSSEPSVVWEPRAVTWRTLGDRCVTVRADPESNQPQVLLSVEPCEAGRADQTFSFEFLPSSGVRIRQTSTGTCVAAPDAWLPGTAPAYPLLTTACGLTRDRFDAGMGTLSVDRRCLYARTFSERLTGLEFGICGPFPEEFFRLTGAFQNADGEALTHSSAEPFLSRAPLADPPAQNQIFDYHF